MSEPTALRAAIYTRLDSKEIADPELDLATQRARAEEYARARGWQVAAHYQDTGYSGLSYSRPGLSRLLADAREGILDAVIVWRLDRLLSETEPMLALIDRLEQDGVRVCAVREQFDSTSPEGQHARRMGAAVLGQVMRHTYDNPPECDSGDSVLFT